MYISGRTRKMLELLLEARNEITIRELAVKLDVSERTVHRDLKMAEEVLHEHELDLLKKPSSGLQITGTGQKKDNLTFILANVRHTDYTPEERRAIILLTLLETKEPVKLFTFAKELQVTGGTISSDLNIVEQSLGKLQLTLQRKQGYGISLEGSEANKRTVISRLFSEHVDESSLITMLKANIRQKSNQEVQTISNRLLGLVPPEKVQIIEREVEQVRGEFVYELADSAYIGLVVHLALAVERLQKGENIQFDADHLKKMRHTNEYVIAGKLIKRLEKAFDMTIPEDETGYITMHLMGAKLKIDDAYLIEDSNLAVAYKAKQLIHYVSGQLNRDLTVYPRLLNDLVAHLKPAIYRLKQQMGIKNPMTAEIKQDYPELFQLLQEGVKETFPDIPFPDEEICYLVLHFASALLQNETKAELSALVICSSGIGTAKMLASKLQQQIPEVKQVYNKSLFELEQTDTDAFDLIISTIPLEEMNEEYILASPMLEQKDIMQIEKAVRRKKITEPLRKREQFPKKQERTADITAHIQQVHRYSEAILQVLDNFRVNQMERNSSVEVVLLEACRSLEEQQVLQAHDTVFEKLRERERIGGLGIPGTSLALFHTRSSRVSKLSFSIYSLQTAVQLEGMDGRMMDCRQILLMLAPEEMPGEGLDVLSFLSSLMIQDASTIDLFESGDEQDIKMFLAEEMKGYLNKKI